MRILEAHVENFGSYKELTFNYTKLGLSLVSGPTGAGKSTLQDIVSWVLFGVTSKGGKVDEVRSWTSDAPTAGTINLNGFIVRRVRGNSKENDLYWSESHGHIRRGKDIIETQKLLEERLGISAELYLTASVFNEFSKTGNFFYNDLQQRRQLFETIANLELPTKVMNGAKNDKKQVKKDSQATEKAYVGLTGTFAGLTRSRVDTISRQDNYDNEKNGRLKQLHEKHKDFCAGAARRLIDRDNASRSWQDTQFQTIDQLLEKLKSIYESPTLTAPSCPNCGNTPGEKLEVMRKIDKLEWELDLQKCMVNPYSKPIEAQESPYIAEIARLESETNPFIDQLAGIDKDIEETDTHLKSLHSTLQDLTIKQNDLDTIYEISQALRGELVKRVISNIQETTNKYLENYFDGEIRVELKITGSDDLEVLIQKSGYECSFSQLSRGQRSMLKLCFSVSVMSAAANRAGVHFNVLCFDEVLDGLSSDLKVKALGLFQELESQHETILLVDHATEIQSQFSRRFNVTLEGDCSRVEEE